MLVYRLVYNATGSDVADVVVAGRLVMHDRKLLTIDEAQVLDNTEAVYARFMARAGLENANAVPAKLWGVARS
jgi:cytosine/adenosine deaminase-related metal-dependent hydrolase